jgi:hypothetical protein
LLINPPTFVSRLFSARSSASSLDGLIKGEIAATPLADIVGKRIELDLDLLNLAELRTRRGFYNEPIPTALRHVMLVTFSSDLPHVQAICMALDCPIGSPESKGSHANDKFYDPPKGHS